MPAIRTSLTDTHQIQPTIGGHQEHPGTPNHCRRHWELSGRAEHETLRWTEKKSCFPIHLAGQEWLMSATKTGIFSQVQCFPKRQRLLYKDRQHSLHHWRVSPSLWYVTPNTAWLETGTLGQTARKARVEFLMKARRRPDYSGHCVGMFRQDLGQGSMVASQDSHQSETASLTDCSNQCFHEQQSTRVLSVHDHVHKQWPMERQLDKQKTGRSVACDRHQETDEICPTFPQHRQREEDWYRGTSQLASPATPAELGLEKCHQHNRWTSLEPVLPNPERARVGSVTANALWQLHNHVLLTTEATLQMCPSQGLSPQHQQVAPVTPNHLLRKGQRQWLQHIKSNRQTTTNYNLSVTKNLIVTQWRRNARVIAKESNLAAYLRN